MADINIDLGDIRGLQGDEGDPGQDGARGSKWFTGTALTHTTGSASTATGIESALAGDMYLNTETSNVYQCTTGGASGTAVWLFLMNIKGANGNGSLIAENATDGYIDVTFTDAESNETTFRAGNTRTTGDATFQTTFDSEDPNIAHWCSARGDVVCVDFMASFSRNASLFASADNWLATLPEGYRPKRIQRVFGLVKIQGGPWLPAMFDIETSGAIQTRWLSQSSGKVTTLLLQVSFMRA